MKNQPKNSKPETLMTDVKKVIPRSSSERLRIVNDTKLKCMDLDLTNDLATKILFMMLDNYYRDGTVYIDKELRLSLRYEIPRKYVINLYNDRSRKDKVLIRALNESEIMKQAASVRDSCPESGPGSDDESEAPDLVNVNAPSLINPKYQK